MNKEFIPYEQALALKELGFDETCFRYYTKHGYLDDYTPIGLSAYFGCHAPLYQQAFRFFRDKYNYNCFVVSSPTSGQFYYYREDMSDRRNDSEPEMTGKYDTYEEAEHACLLKLNELVKQK